MNEKTINKLMEKIDKTKKPKHWKKFINKNTVTHNLILKCGNRAYCTHCHKYFDERVEVHTYKKYKCKWCNNKYYVVNSNKRIFEFKSDISFFTKVDNYIVLRIFEILSKYDFKTKSFKPHLKEYVRFIPNVGVYINNCVSFYMWYEKVYHNTKIEKWHKYTGNKILYEMPIYPYNKKWLYKNTALQYAPIEELKEMYQYNNFKNLQIASFESFEFLWKMKLYKLSLASQKFTQKGSFFKVFGVPKTFLKFMVENNIDYWQYEILKITQIPDMSYINKLYYYNTNYLRLMKKQGYINNFSVLEKFRYDYDYLRIILKYVSLKKLLEYKKGLDNLQIYADYLEMANKLSLNYKSKKDLFPRNLKSRHDKLQVKIEVNRSMETQTKCNLRFLNLSKYIYQDEKYIIFPAPTVEDFIDEGKQQENCVARLYLPKYVDGNTEIFFIRKLDNAEKSFITLEYKNGSIIQKELPNHSTNFKTEHLKFINKWLGHRNFVDLRNNYSKMNNFKTKKYDISELAA